MLIQVYHIYSYLFPPIFYFYLSKNPTFVKKVKSQGFAQDEEEIGWKQLTAIASGARFLR